MAENPKDRTESGQGKLEKPGTQTFIPGATEVRTNDPGIAQPVVNPPPERAVAFQTAGLSGSPSAYPLAGSSGVVQCAEKNGGEQNRQKPNAKQQQQDEGGKQNIGEQDSDEDDRERPQRQGGNHKQHGHSHHHNKENELKRKMPRWPTLLITCILALVCGAGGALGYSALFGSGKADHGKQSGKGEKGGKGGSGKSGESDSDQNSTTDNLKKGLGQLADRMDELGTRIDRLNQATQEGRMQVPQYYPGSSRIERMAPANDGSAPIPTAFQTQLTVLQHKVDQMEDLPGRVQELDRRLTELQEAINILVAAHPASDGAGQ
jgi:hypothetical protein